MSVTISGLLFVQATFNGTDARGGSVSISVPGLKVGDVFIGLSPMTSPLIGNDFESIVSANDNILQIGGNQTGVTFTAVFLRNAT